MRHLLDTQIFIWTLINPERLSKNTQDILQDNEILVSQVSFLEIAIKQKIGKLPELNVPVMELSQRAEQDGIGMLALRIEHIQAYDAVPLFAHHRDPFDRLLLATALSETIPILSADEHFGLYSSWVRIIPNT